MPKRVFRILATATVLLLITNVLAHAQSTAPKFEIGAQFALTRLRDLNETDFGVGGRITYNITDNIGVEGELNFFPRELVGFALSSFRTQGLFGVKTGLRSERAGIFAKIRPGFLSFNKRDDVLCSPPNSLACVNGRGATYFALDLGGVFELYPSRRVVVRFDLGDTIVRFGRPVLEAPDGFTSHNIQFNVGVGFRF